MAARGRPGRWGGPGARIALARHVSCPELSRRFRPAAAFAAMLFGVSTLGVVADQYGRRRGFLASALLMGAAGLASALAPSFAVSPQ